MRVDVILSLWHVKEYVQWFTSVSCASYIRCSLTQADISSMSILLAQRHGKKSVLKMFGNTPPSSASSVISANSGSNTTESPS